MDPTTTVELPIPPGPVDIEMQEIILRKEFKDLYSNPDNTHLIDKLISILAKQQVQIATLANGLDAFTNAITVKNTR